MVRCEEMVEGMVKWSWVSDPLALAHSGRGKKECLVQSIQPCKPDFHAFSRWSVNRSGVEGGMERNCMPHHDGPYVSCH